MCEANAYLIKDGKEELLLVSLVDHRVIIEEAKE
jgi:hypothetical protein